MQEIILSLYSGLTVLAFMCLSVSLTVLWKCHSDQKYDGTFWYTLSTAMVWAGMLMQRTWWTIWKSNKISNEASVWMENHIVVAIFTLLIIAGGILKIKVLSEDEAYGRLWKICAGVVFCVCFLVYIISE